MKKEEERKNSRKKVAGTPLNKSFPPGPSFAVNRVPFCPEAANQSETPARDSTSVHVIAELA
jgi:hypothetical protein